MKHGLSVWNRIAIPALSGAALVVGTNAQAQSTAGATVELKEVVVTATRRSEDVQRSAIAVSVLTGDMIEAKGVPGSTRRVARGRWCGARRSRRNVSRRLVHPVGRQ